MLALGSYFFYRAFEFIGDVCYRLGSQGELNSKGSFFRGKQDLEDFQNFRAVGRSEGVGV